jgi:hypothetical protein
MDGRLPAAWDLTGPRRAAKGDSARWWGETEAGVRTEGRQCWGTAAGHEEGMEVDGGLGKQGRGERWGGDSGTGTESGKFGYRW